MYQNEQHIGVAIKELNASHLLITTKLGKSMVDCDVLSQSDAANLLNRTKGSRLQQGHGGTGEISQFVADGECVFVPHSLAGSSGTA